MSDDKIYVVTCAFNIKREKEVSLDDVVVAVEGEIGIKSGILCNKLWCVLWRRIERNLNNEVTRAARLVELFLNRQLFLQKISINNCYTLRSGSLSFSLTRILLTCSLSTFSLFFMPFSHPPWIKIFFLLFSFQVRDDFMKTKTASKLS